jgi:hypothetical protein
MPRLTIDVNMTGRRPRSPAEDRGPQHAPEQRVDWRPLPNERRSRERRGTQGFARFAGPGGEAEHTMTHQEAQAIATALGVPFELAPDENVRTLKPQERGSA